MSRDDQHDPLSAETLDRVGRFFDEVVSSRSAPSAPPEEGLEEIFFSLQELAHDEEGRLPSDVAERVWDRVSASWRR